MLQNYLLRENLIDFKHKSNTHAKFDVIENFVNVIEKHDEKFVIFVFNMLHDQIIINRCRNHVDIALTRNLKNLRRKI